METKPVMHVDPNQIGDGSSYGEEKKQVYSRSVSPSQTVPNSPTVPSSPVIPKKSGKEKAKQCCRKFVVFLFSTAGMTVLLFAYIGFGGLLFMKIEGQHEEVKMEEFQTINEVADKSADEAVAKSAAALAASIEMKQSLLSESMLNQTVENLWRAIEEMNIFNQDVMYDTVRRELSKYVQLISIGSKELSDHVKDVFGELNQTCNNHTDSNVKVQEFSYTSPKWTYPNSLLFAITIITTIGYGHIAPKTPFGQLATVLYAIVGIPLNFLTIANIGQHMATAFRFLYKNVFCRHCIEYHEEMTISAAVQSINKQVQHTYMPVDVKEPNEKSSIKEDPARNNFDGKEKDNNIDNADDVPATEINGQHNKARTSQQHDVIVTMQEQKSDDAIVVPLWIPTLIILGYVTAGAVLFNALEPHWNIVVGFYFCFVTLTTIGLGDFVPGTDFDQISYLIIMCIAYVFLGLALIAMCFDLMQNEVRLKFRDLGYKLGILEPKVVDAPASETL